MHFCTENVLFTITALLTILTTPRNVSAASVGVEGSSLSVKSQADEELCALEDIEVHTVFAVDCSKSLDDKQFNIAMKFAANVTNFVGQIQSSRPAKMGIFQFASDVSMMVPLKTSSNWNQLASNLTKSYIHPRNRDISGIGTTNTEMAVRKIGNMLQRGRNESLNNSSLDQTAKIVSLAFILTDGQTKNTNSLAEEIQRLRRLNITVYSIGAGELCTEDTEEIKLDVCVNMTQMELISGSVNRTHHVEQYEELGDILESVLMKVCDDLKSNLIQIIGLGAGVLVGIVVLSIVAVLIIYAVQDVIRNKIMAAQLTADADALKNRQSVRINPLYKDQA